MAMIEIKSDPSLAELRIFALLWLVFFCVLGWLTPQIAGALLIAAIVTGGCAGLALAFSREDPLPLRLRGLLTPAALLVMWGAIRAAEASGAGGPVIRAGAVTAMSALGVAGGLIVLLSPRSGRNLYRWWMGAVGPIGWTIAHILLGTVYYLVITPIGLAMRTAGYDPMARSGRSDSPSYWAARRPRPEARRYFRQF
ncbi:MAG: SxtJ family membrane protein [Phycisphaerales bacterium JB039]